MITVLIVDDETDVRDLIRVVVSSANHGLTVSGEAANGVDALEQWRENRPGVVILDQRMPGMTGLEVAQQMLSEHPEQTIILFSAFLDPKTQEAADALGVHSLDKTQVMRLPEELWRLGRPA